MNTTNNEYNLGYMRDFEEWSDYYISHFARMSDDDLKSYWWLYGRDSNDLRNMAAWSAVNAEMQRRGL